MAFPLGAYYYCDDAMDVGAIQRLSMIASRAKRRVQPLHRVNSSGQVCGLGFYTESGNDLASLAHKYISRCADLMMHFKSGVRDDDDARDQGDFSPLLRARLKKEGQKACCKWEEWTSRICCVNVI